MTYWKTVAAFILGGAIGSVATACVLKKHYDAMNERDIAEMKAYYEKKYAAPKKNDVGDSQGHNEETPEIVPTPEERETALKEYENTLKAMGYRESEDAMPDDEIIPYVGDDVVNKNLTEVTGAPYGISPDDFGEHPDYEQVVLLLYKDGVVADESDTVINPIDLRSLIGVNWKDLMGEYEDDAAFIRNDRLKIDYQILTNLHTFEHRLSY